MRKMIGKNCVWLLLALMAFGCGDSGNKQGAGSAIEGLFGPSDAEKKNSKDRDAQTQQLKNQADQMQKDRLDTY